MQQIEKELLSDNKKILELRKALRVLFKETLTQLKESIIKVDSLLEMVSQINVNLVNNGK